MPKPDLMPLTGGYRKTPVLQIGADIYCDTQLIMLEIERRAARAAVACPRAARARRVRSPCGSIATSSRPQSAWS